MKGISKPEFAKREGYTSLAQIQFSINAGELVPYADGSINPDLIGTGWCPRNRKRIQADEFEKKRETAANKDHSNVASVMNQSSFVATSKLHGMKESYAALLKKIEYDEAVGIVVKKSVVAKVLANQLTKVRTRLAMIPGDVAPLLINIKHAEEARGIVENAINEVLIELTSGPS